ncbi:MAG: bile acid:sodium symporter family protein [Chthoniobacteraceae bacterium]
MDALLQQIQTLSVLAFLVSSMGAIGLVLTPRAIAAPLRDRRFVLLALSLNFVLAPGFAWLLTVVIPLDRAHVAGLLLLGGAAGAPFLPKLVEMANGDIAPAAALMALLTAGTILFLPFALPLMIPGLSADPWSIARPLLLLIIVPLAAGMLVRSRAAAFAARVAPVLATLGNASLLLLFVLLVALNSRALIAVIGSGAILAALIFFSALFVFGWLLGGSQRRVLSLATAARNFGAALAPATNCFDDPNVTVMIIVGAIVCLVVTFFAAGWVRRQQALG